MKIKGKAIVSVQRVGEYFEYYIQEGDNKINFFLFAPVHYALKAAQSAAEHHPQEHPAALL